jgi:Na+/melibiose symporter-like transporter
MHKPSSNSTSPALGRHGGWRSDWRYGVMGFPLAFVALPLYVVLPNHYARNFGVPLATLGAVLLATRLLDALIDPLLGRWSDKLFARSAHAVLRWAGGLRCCSFHPCAA